MACDLLWLFAMTSNVRVLVIADDFLGDILSAAIRTNGYEVHACRTPLDAIQVLERHSPQICYAVLSAAEPHALEVGELLTDEYPAIQQLLLSL